MPTTCDDELVTPTHTGAQWQLRSILSQPEKGRDDVTIKICPLEPLGDSQLSDAQYEKAMSLKAEKEAKASQKLAEQQALRVEKEAKASQKLAEKEASRAEKEASKAEKAASKAEAKLAPVKEAEKAEAAMRVAEAQVEALNTTLKQQAWERVDGADYVKNRTNASAYWGIEDQAVLATKIEDLRQDEYWQVYIQLRNESNYQTLVTKAHELAKASKSVNARKAKALRNTSVSELTKTAEEAKTKAEALAKVAEEAKTKAEEVKARVAAPAKNDGAMSDEEPYEQDDDEEFDESIRRPHRVTVICCCHACCCCVVCAGPCARPARSLGGRPQCGNQYLKVCRVLERGAATPRVLERSGRLPYK